MRNALKSTLYMVLVALAVMIIPVAAAHAFAPAHAPATTVTANVAVRVRTGPATTYPQIGVVYPSVTVPVTGRNSSISWLYVEYLPGKTGWLAAWLVTPNGDLSSLPVVTSGSTTQPPVSTPPPGPAFNPTGYVGHYSNVSTNVKTIYSLGQQMGNNSYAFSKVGDCEASFPDFLQDFDKGTYNLGSYSYLQPVIARYPGSFGHVGQAANAGMSSMALLQPIFADPKYCNAGETPLACEYRLQKPSVALIMVRTLDQNSIANGTFYYEVNQIVQYSTSHGVIPVLSTMPYWGPYNPDTNVINDVIRRVANANNIPLWDFYASAETLPGRGVTQDYHINDPAYTRAGYFDATSLQMGVTRRNLEALEVLHAVLAQIQ